MDATPTDAPTVAPTDPAPILVRCRTVLVVSLMVSVALLVLHLLSRWFTIDGETLIPRHQFLNMDDEISVPTWWQQSLNLAGAVVCFLVAGIRRRAGEGDVGRWRILGAIFVYLSLDEGTQLHEGLIDPMQRMFDIDSGPLLFAWVIPGMLALLAFAAFYLRFWLALPSRPRLFVGLGGAVFVGGALGIEMLGGIYRTTEEAGEGYALFTGFEEAFEMVGASLFVYGVLLVALHSQGSATPLRVVDE
jgi:hypothetical protein